MIKKLKLKRSYLIDQIDKLNFKRILFLWLFVIIFFGLFYRYVSNENAFLIYSKSSEPVNDILDYIYFSFVTATTTGFGDIVPFAYFKLVTMAEVIFGLLLLAMVTSKLVSIKQDAILNELYEFSFSEKISKLRSELLLFRQHINRLLTKGEENALKKGDANEIESQITAFEHALTEAYMLISRSSDSQFIKNIGQVNSEIIFNSILHSFEKLYEAIIIFEHHKIEWNSELTKKHIIKCISLNDNIFTKAETEKTLLKETLIDMNIRKERVISNIKSKIIE